MEEAASSVRMINCWCPLLKFDAEGIELTAASLFWYGCCRLYFSPSEKYILFRSLFFILMDVLGLIKSNICHTEGENS
jgi:hypothetical protein